MKNVCLLFISWVIALTPLSAQKSLPSSIQSYSVNWSFAVKQMLDAAGYQVPGPKAEFDLRPQITNPSDKPQLDSTITYYGYGINANDSLPLFRYTYTYPQPDVQVVIESYNEQGIWTPLSMSTLVTDEAGRLVDAITFSYQAETAQFIPDARIVFFPHGTSGENIDSFFVFKWSVQLEDYVRQMAVWNQYDQLGRLTVSTSSIEIFEFPRVFRDSNVYDKAGNLITVESFYKDGEQWIHAGHQESAYDGKNVTRTTNYIPNGFGVYIPQHKVEYTYTIFGKQESVLFYDWDMEHNSWKVVLEDTYSYDHDKRVSIHESSHLTQGDEYERNRLMYTYSHEDYPSLETSFSWNRDNQSWELGEKKYYHYTHPVSADPGEEEVADAQFMYPNPTSGVVQVKLGGKVSVHIYTLSGQLVKRFYMSPGDRVLDLSALPAGMYQVRAMSDDDYYSGKLLVQ